MDLELRLNKDMLVLSGSFKDGLRCLNIEKYANSAILNVLEQDTVKNALMPYVVAGAQCIVANTSQLLQSVLSHYNLDDRLEELAASALKIASQTNPQHIIVELGSCGLPLDDCSKNSLNENKNQYVRSARIFENINSQIKFDAYMLKDFKSLSELKCALMGIRQVSDKAIFVSSHINADGNICDGSSLADYLNVLNDYGATVAGISTDNNLEFVSKICNEMHEFTYLPLLVELECSKDESTPYFYPDSMKEASVCLNKAGVQFVRAIGDASPAYTAVLSAYCKQLGFNNSV